MNTSFLSCVGGYVRVEQNAECSECFWTTSMMMQTS